MYKDSITSEKLVGLYILMNKHNSYLYDAIFDSIKKIIAQNDSISLNVKYIITDSKFPLIKCIIAFKYYLNIIIIL